MSGPKPTAEPQSGFRQFIDSETAGGFVLVVALIEALVWANTVPLHYYNTWLTVLPVHIGHYSLMHTAQTWINEGLMALFFLLVGLELKRELRVGVLAGNALLPILTALGGMLVPALIYVGVVALSKGGINPELIKGWGIPVATDIALALGVLALLGKRVPAALRVLLSAIAIVDDLGAVLVIALFYSHELAWLKLGTALFVFGVLLIINRIGVKMLLPYILLGMALWFALLDSGVDASLAGVLLAFTIPLGNNAQRGASPLERLARALKGPVAWAIMPLFALANAGVELKGAEVVLQTPVLWGVLLGLALGKPVGIIAAAWAAGRLGLAVLPEGISSQQFVAMAVLCGMGFTMSLFIAGRAFGSGSLLLTEARLAIMLATVVSGGIGAWLLAGRSSKLKV